MQARFQERLNFLGFIFIRQPLHPPAIALSNMNSFKSKSNSTQSPTVSSLAKNIQRGAHHDRL
jgi:hypothetical protein